jgi:hypothetical protein
VKWITLRLDVSEFPAIHTPPSDMFASATIGSSMAETQSDLAHYQSDHDLLIGLTKDVAHLSLSVTDLNTAVTKKNDDHEARLRVLESKVEDQRSTSTTWRFVIGVGLPVVFACIGWLFLQTYTLNSTIDSRISRAISY